MFVFNQISIDFLKYFYKDVHLSVSFSKTQGHFKGLLVGSSINLNLEILQIYTEPTTTFKDAMPVSFRS